MNHHILTALFIVSMASSSACAEETSVLPATQTAANVEVFDLAKGSRPHDAAPAPDGKIWYSAQRQGALGVVDPSTGEIEQIALGPDSAPHGVIQGPDGMAWITDGGQNAIVRFDPTTRKLDVWKLPEDTGYTNLNTGAFDGKGDYWFTGQNGVYGRVDPTSGKVDVWKDPKGRGPYGIATSPDGTVWYVSLAGSHLARIDNVTGAIDVIEPPTPGAGLRRIWADSKGDLWISGWNSGELYRYRPADKSWKTWPLPGEAPKAYAVYVDERDHVWVSDFAANATLDFDPIAESWAAYPGSAPNAQVRQILGRPGKIYLPESRIDRIMVVTTTE